jgi:hypothetical protein
MFYGWKNIYYSLKYIRKWLKIRERCESESENSISAITAKTVFQLSLPFECTFSFSLIFDP